MASASYTFTMLLTMNAGCFHAAVGRTKITTDCEKPFIPMEPGILIASKRDLHAEPRALLLSAVINLAPRSMFH